MNSYHVRGAGVCPRVEGQQIEGLLGYPGTVRETKVDSREADTPVWRGAEHCGHGHEMVVSE